jgi:hypothetical protein
MEKHIAFVDGNRAINKNNVKKHIESLKKFGKNLVPLLYVEATDVVGHTLYDAESGDEVAQNDYPNYWVILDGQHRYKAAVELAASDDANGFTLDALWWEKVNLDGKSFEDVLIEVNSRTQPWKGADYICGCVLHNPENEALQFAHTLVGQGVSGKTVAKYLFAKDKFKWADAMADASLMADADVPRAKAIWAVVKKFPQKMQKTSIIIDHLNAVGKYWNVELDKIDALANDQKESFNSSKVTELRSKFTDLMSA